MPGEGADLEALPKLPQAVGVAPRRVVLTAPFGFQRYEDPPRDLADAGRPSSADGSFGARVVGRAVQDAPQVRLIPVEEHQAVARELAHVVGRGYPAGEALDRVSQFAGQVLRRFDIGPPRGRDPFPELAVDGVV